MEARRQESPPSNAARRRGRSARAGAASSAAARTSPAVPVRGLARAYVAPFRAPFRVFSGFRFYSAFPGSGYVYVPGYGWVLPPFFGAVWVPGHDDIDGDWVEGFWR